MRAYICIYMVVFVTLNLILYAFVRHSEGLSKKRLFNNVNFVFEGGFFSLCGCLILCAFECYCISVCTVTHVYIYMYSWAYSGMDIYIYIYIHTHIFTV